MRQLLNLDFICTMIACVLWNIKPLSTRRIRQLLQKPFMDQSEKITNIPDI